jgi:alginate O-acetyltransferase complex protein AlgI
LYWLLKGDRTRLAWLTLMNYVFYAYWRWEFSFLLLFVTLVDFLVGYKIGTATDPKKRKMWLVVSLVSNLGLLGFFKYYVLLAMTANYVGQAFNIGNILPPWNIILPIGISFFTFQSMSYTIDVYRKEVPATRDFFEYAAYVSLFPHFIAGPIIRYAQIAETLRHLPKKLTTENLNLGLIFFAAGLVKKVLIADRIAHYINPMFVDYQNLIPSEAWMAMIGYSMQLYFDFAGYSLMAIGLGHLLGFTFPRNFDSPYQAVSISDFWRRWHMSLSRWLRDYLYVPLGGRNNRMFALAITMLLGGLWHGAYWTFMVWGAYHGLALTLHHALKNATWFPRNIVWARFGTFVVATIGWVFFRPPTFSEAWVIFGKLFDIKGLLQYVSFPRGFILVVLVAIVISMFTPNIVHLIKVKKAEPKMGWIILLGILTVICVLCLSKPAPFLYFQF